MIKKSSRKISDTKISYLGLLRQFKWGESYTSLLLGIFVVIIIALFIISFVRNRGSLDEGNQSQISSDKTEAQSEDTEKKEGSGASSQRPQLYTVVAGDDLWKIAQRLYKSGYNWVDIARVNNLKNPDMLVIGTKLKIPDVKPVSIDKNTSIDKAGAMKKINGSISIKESSYSVKKGDYLWDIAVRAYGDGYKWVEIARANKLVNPNYIHSGNVLKIPR